MNEGNLGIWRRTLRTAALQQRADRRSIAESGCRKRLSTSGRQRLFVLLVLEYFPVPAWLVVEVLEELSGC